MCTLLVRLPSLLAQRNSSGRIWHVQCPELVQCEADLFSRFCLCSCEEVHLVLVEERIVQALPGLLEAGLVPLDCPPLPQQGVPAREIALSVPPGHHDLRSGVTDCVPDQLGALSASLTREDTGSD